MFTAPLEHLRIYINTHSCIVLLAPDPLTAHTGRTTEIFPQVLCPPVAQLAEGFVHKLVFRSYALHGFLIQHMPVSKFGHGLLALPAALLEILRLHSLYLSVLE